MASMNKIPTPILPMAPLQPAAVQPPHFFIAPNYTLAPNTTDPTLPGGIGIAGSPWSTAVNATALRPSSAIPCYNPTSATDVYFNSHCLLPVPPTNHDKLATPPVTCSSNGSSNSSSSSSSGGTSGADVLAPNKRQRKASLQLSEESPVKIKKEANQKSVCALRNSDSISSDRDGGISYPVSALIDTIPGSLTRGSRTSSLSSSLSTVRFGGSLSQLWAASISSLGKLNNMKSTGNINAEASLPSLGNQYFAFGGSLPELSLTSLSRLLPNSTSNSSTSSTITATPSTTNLLTVLQPPLYVYPSQPHLATPFINANGSITFGSFLSTGSSLCSTQKPDSPVKEDERSIQSIGESSTPAPSTASHNVSTPVSLNTLAYVASAQKNLDTHQEPHQYKLTPVSDHSPPDMGISPSTESVGIMECHSLSPMDQRVKMEAADEDDSGHSMGSYSEVKPYFMMMSPATHPQAAPTATTTPNGSVPCKKEGKDRPYKCDYPGCGRSFSFPAHLKSHVQQIHISYRPCKCDFPGCGKRFYTPQHLNVHRRIHTGERPFVCPYTDCNKAFTTAGNLKNHIRTHTGERPYACKFEGCTKRFAEMSSLKKHELTHTGEKPYKCRVCNKAFSQAGSRNTHERKHNRTESDAKVSRRYRIKRVMGDGDCVPDGVQP